MTDEFRKLKDEFVTILNTRIAWFVLGIVLGAGGNAKSIYAVLSAFVGL